MLNKVKSLFSDSGKTITGQDRAPEEQPASLFFYTLHKCASTLFSDCILKNIEGLKHVDYASQVYNGVIPDTAVSFSNRGYVYGPIRLSTGPVSPVYRALVGPASKIDFIRDKKAIFFIRDPRDILVSTYYSFGFSHGLSPLEFIRLRQLANRERIQKMTLDEYVIDSAPKVIKSFDRVYELSQACSRCVVLKYEDLVDQYDLFIKEFRKYASISDDVERRIYEQSRPVRKEDTTSHRRSGQVKGFQGKLQEQTIRTINDCLGDVLTRFGYDS